MSKHITYTDYARQIDELVSVHDHSSEPGKRVKDCPVCELENSLEILLHNDQPPTCPKCGARMREVEVLTNVHACNNSDCDYVCRFENDDEEASCYYVDVPNPECKSDDDNMQSWVNVGIFDTRKEAEEFLLKRYGIQPSLADVFLTEGRQ